jgi:hypothetical protein
MDLSEFKYKFFKLSVNLYEPLINRKNLCSSARQCGSARDVSGDACSAHCVTVRTVRSVGAVHAAAVCGSVLGTSVWQCATVRQCGMQCAAVCGRVRQRVYGSVWQCEAVQQCAAVCGSAAVCSSVWQCVAVCSSVRQCEAVRLVTFAAAELVGGSSGLVFY